ncbi:MAG: hypothetical protein Q6L54_03350 [Gloeomargarita sp. HHBFW_bins_205]
MEPLMASPQSLALVTVATRFPIPWARFPFFTALTADYTHAHRLR